MALAYVLSDVERLLVGALGLAQVAKLLVCDAHLIEHLRILRDRCFRSSLVGLYRLDIFLPRHQNLRAHLVFLAVRERRRTFESREGLMIGASLRGFEPSCARAGVTAKISEHGKEDQAFHRPAPYCASACGPNRYCGGFDPSAGCLASAKDTKYLVEKAFFLVALVGLLLAVRIVARTLALRRLRFARTQHSNPAAAGCGGLSPLPKRCASHEPPGDCASCPPWSWQYCVGSVPVDEVLVRRLRAGRGGELARLRVDHVLHDPGRRLETAACGCTSAAAPPAS